MLVLGNILQIVSAPGQQILRPQGSMVMQTVAQTPSLSNASPAAPPTPPSVAPQGEPVHMPFHPLSHPCHFELWPGTLFANLTVEFDRFMLKYLKIVLSNIIFHFGLGLQWC